MNFDMSVVDTFLYNFNTSHDTRGFPDMANEKELSEVKRPPASEYCRCLW